MNEVTKVLSSPAVKAGLHMLAPELGLGIELVSTIFKGLADKQPSINQLLSIVDKQLAVMLHELATTKSEFHRHELEIRIHTLLGVIFEWDKVK